MRECRSIVPKEVYQTLVKRVNEAAETITAHLLVHGIYWMGLIDEAGAICGVERTRHGGGGGTSAERQSQVWHGCRRRLRRLRRHV